MFSAIDYNNQWEDQAKELILPSLDPGLARLGTVTASPDGDLRVNLILGTGAHPDRESLNLSLQESLSALPWARNIQVKFQLAKPKSGHKDVPPSLQNVGKIIAVTSCKGGVGKSTVSCNLSYALAALGGRVGLFDADIFGPSLPYQVDLPPSTFPIKQSTDTKLLHPPVVEGVKLMSYGFVAPGTSTGEAHTTAAAMRGPMVSTTVTQLVAGTDWGDLDYLVLDFPPGTGDIHLTLCQRLGISCCVVVTTPQQLSYVDVVKGVNMFEKMKVPVSAVVHNMAHFDVDGKRHFPFGRGHMDELLERIKLGPDSCFTLPIQQELSLDISTPRVLADPTDSIAQEFTGLARHLVLECARMDMEREAETGRPQIAYNPKRGIVLRFFSGEREGHEYVVDPATLRRHSKDAQSVDEMTGEQRIHPDTIPDDIEPVEFRVQGNYGVGIKWSDGHDAAIYTYDQIVELALS